MSARGRRRVARLAATLVIAVPTLVACTTSIAGRAVRAAKPAAAGIYARDLLLRPAGSSNHAESAYRFCSAALYAESVDVYPMALSVHEVASNGFSAVSQCHTDAIGVSPQGVFQPMELSFFGTTDDGVLVWNMTRPDWTCNRD